MKYTKYVIVAMIAFLAVGCSTLKVAVEKPSDASFENAEKIGMLKINFLERDLPIIPILDAGVYRGVVKKHIDEFKAIEKEEAVLMNELYVKEISEKTGKSVELIENTIENTDGKFFETPACKERIQAVARENGCQLLFVVVSRVDTIKVGTFGIKGDINLKNQVYLFDENGEVKGKGFFVSASDSTMAGSIDGYKEVIQNYKVLIPQLVGLLIK